MQGRIENKLKIENRLKNKIDNYPLYVKKYYYSLNNKTHMTKSRYIENTIRFLDYLTKENIIDVNNYDEIRHIDSFIIEQYISNIDYFYNKEGNINELSNNTKACIYSSLNSFFEFLRHNDYISRNPFDSGCIERPRIRENDVVFLSPEEVKNIEDVILNQGVGNDLSKSKQENWRLRDYLLFRIPVINGIRVTALSEINIKDINFKENSIRVTEKGNITKNVYFDDKTKQYLIEWMKERRDILQDTQCDALFISNRKKRMNVRSIEIVINKYTSGASNGKHITPHKLRSTFGTNLYQSTKDIYLVADALGHKSTAPTKRYTKIFDEDKKNAIKIVSNMYD